jgi:hypothetical protein
MEDLTRAKNRRESFLLRHGRSAGGIHLDTQGSHPARPASLRRSGAANHVRAPPRDRRVPGAERAAIEADLAPCLDEAPQAEPVRRLAAHWNVDRLGALVLERGGGRLCGASGRAPPPGPPATRCCPSTPRAPASTAARSPTPARLTGAASRWWPRGSTASARGSGAGLPTQVDLCRRFRRLAAKKSVHGVVVAAIVPRLVRSLHAEMVF